MKNKENGLGLSGSRILVIGGAGFIGSHLVDLLTREEVKEILIYDDFSRGKKENLEEALQDRRVKLFELGGDILRADLLDTAFRGVDYVFHLAALWLLHCQEFPASAFEVNVRGTFNVLQACVAHQVKKLIFSSSASVYGDAAQIPMTEEHPFNNRTFYGATKIAGEQMCRAFSHRYGLNFVGLRYMNVYGQRQDALGAYTSVIMKALERLEQGKSPIVFGDGSQSYDFIHVQDVARANVLALKSDATDEFINVGRGVKTTIRELVEKLLLIAGSDLKPEYQPAEQVFVTHRVGSTQKAQQLLDSRLRSTWRGVFAPSYSIEG